jgi:hypothetical protein
MAKLNTFYQTLFRQVAMATEVENNAVLRVGQRQKQEGMLDAGILFLCHEYKHSASDSTKSPASGMAILGKPSLMALMGESSGSRMRIEQCVSAIGRWRCQYSYGSLRADTSVARLRVGHFWDTR